MYSLGVQRQVAPSVVAVIQYVGSLGWSQNNDRNINTLPLNDLAHRQGVAGQVPDPTHPGQFLPSLNANLYRIFPGFSTITQEENETNFNYNSLQAGLRIENLHGWTVQFAYTFSHELDNVSNDLNILTNPFNAAYDYGSGAFDRRHIFNASYIYNLPWFLHSSNALERTVIGGWVFSGITYAESGLPQAINYTGPDVLGLGGNGATNRESQVASVSYPKKQTAWFSTSSFADPIAPWAGGTNQGFGSAGKDAVVLPGLFNFNMSLYKNIPLTPSETGPKIELRFESYNTFNHTQFQNIDANSTDGNFGQVTSSYDGRRLQLGAKFSF